MFRAIIQRIKLLHLVGIATVLSGVAIGCAATTDTGSGSEPLWVDPATGCSVFYTPLKTSRLEYLGSIDIINDDTNLIVEITGTGGYSLVDVALFAGAGSPGTDPSLYPYQRDFSGSPVATTTFTIPLADISAACGTGINLAVYAHVTKDGVTKTGWGYGTPFGTDGWYFVYDMCCDEPPPPPPPPPPGCTYTQGYWKNHLEDWPLSSVDLGGVTYTAEEALALMVAPVRTDVSMALAQQLIAALLNVANGASTTPEVAAAIAAAQAWMAAHADGDGRLPYRTSTSASYRAEAVSLNEQLTAFNEGTAGTLHCGD